MTQNGTYPHITCTPGVLGGVPCIEGTRIPVRSIAGYFNMGMTVDEMLAGWDRLNPAQIFAALSYYFDHKAEIDADIADNNDTAKWEEYTRVNKLKRESTLVAA